MISQTYRALFIFYAGFFAAVITANLIAVALRLLFIVVGHIYMYFDDKRYMKYSVIKMIVNQKKALSSSKSIRLTALKQ